MLKVSLTVGMLDVQNVFLEVHTISIHMWILVSSCNLHFDNLMIGSCFVFWSNCWEICCFMLPFPHSVISNVSSVISCEFKTNLFLKIPLAFPKNIEILLYLLLHSSNVDCHKADSIP